MTPEAGSNYILYACAGCSKGGQAAYKIAIDLGDRGITEMSCLAGIASGGKSFFRKLKGRKIAVIDGCAIECARTVIVNQGLVIDKHFSLQYYGVKKNIPSTNEQLESILKIISDKLKD